jgi:hypothetical protein
MTIGNFIEFKSITLGEAILIGLTIGLPTLGILFQYARERTFAFKFVDGTNSIEHGQIRLFRVTLKARVSATLERFNVRFVEKRWLGIARKNASTADIEIVDVGGVEWRAPYRRTHSWNPDGTGGFDVTFDPPKNWVAGDFLYFDIKVAAHKNWVGHLSFEAVTTKHRLYVRWFFQAL